MNVWKVFMTSNTVLKLFKKVPPQALLVRVKYKLLLNRKVVKGLCTQQDLCVSFDNPAVQKYIENLRMEFKTLKTENDCYEGHKKRRMLEILPIINIIEERNALNENLASLKELTSGQNI
jgi:tyrosine-protein phosphatase YwqE